MPQIKLQPVRLSERIKLITAEMFDEAALAEAPWSPLGQGKYIDWKASAVKRGRPGPEEDDTGPDRGPPSPRSPRKFGSEMRATDNLTSAVQDYVELLVKNGSSRREAAKSVLAFCKGAVFPELNGTKW